MRGMYWKPFMGKATSMEQMLSLIYVTALELSVLLRITGRTGL